MTDREKIAELLKLPHCNATSVEACYDCEYAEITDCYTERLLDHLLANGVTAQKWISVEDRLPEGANGKSLSEDVIAYTKNNEVCTGWLCGDKWWLVVGGDDQHSAFGEGFVTHWMPMPKPPKGE